MRTGYTHHLIVDKIKNASLHIKLLENDGDDMSLTLILINENLTIYVNTKNQVKPYF